jgi:DNA-binding response OmpR family regulator
MPIKILLADKSITIQKVVEMLFSGKEYEVVCVSDGDTALQEASRVVPDVVLADVDLPRIDGYSFAGRLKHEPRLSRTPVILMMSRDDVYDSVKGSQEEIFDHIAKPFESQELIGKVKKALAAAPTRLAESGPAVSGQPVPTTTRPASSVTPPIAKPKQAAPSDIFDIIKEAPTQAELKKAAELPNEEESVFEVEPEVEEVEETLPRESSPVLPVGDKAVEEMRAGLGLTEQPTEPEIVPFEEFDMARETAPKSDTTPKPVAPPRSAHEPPAPQQFTDDQVRGMVEASVAKAVKEAIENRAAPAPAVLPEAELRGMAEKIISKMAQDMFKSMPAPSLPKISDDTVRRGVEDAVLKIARDIAREVIERVAWEVIPPLAEQMIKEEIERLKAVQ